ncbi:Cation/H+ exchanger [Cynara cardunculus var. scolymus]|uniref:Cation/H+ exchanger n=1 Tax=Cynara cardunculus var. scolymus TaxID=59895 RepID=A0A118K024_CYNCS|nr:Cation/H+ exchanger [Cynara cardunculus var. scolymus]
MDSNETTPKDPRCTQVTVMKVANIAVNMLVFIVTLALCNILHMLLRPYSQPRLISEAIVGFFLSNLPFIRNNFDDEANTTLGYVAEFGMICHMFVVGLETDPNIFVRLPVREAKVACTGLLITFLIAVFVTPMLQLTNEPSIKFDVSISIILSGTASPLLTRLIADHKIGKSDIGRFLIATGLLSDLISTLLITLGYIIFDPLDGFATRKVENILLMVAVLVVQTIFAAKFVPFLMAWVDSHNPQGKLMKGSHLIVSLASIVLVCSLAPWITRFNMMLSSFLAGVVMPREGRIPKMLIGKVKYFFGILFFPAFMFWVGFQVEFSEFEGRRLITWASIFFLFLIIVAGKVFGSVISGVLLGFHWQDSSIIERARKQSPTQQMALQWLSPSNELRIVLCVHGPESIQSAINFMEISQGLPESRMTVYVNDMIELTENIASTLAQGEGVDAMTITDPGIIEMRENITNTIQGYVNEQCEGIEVRRMLTLCPLTSMHHDICTLAEDLLVLRHAPCSVGVLVDRGLGSTQLSRATKCINAAIIFIAGKDDREALAYAGRVARHPSVKLTVIRFLLDTNGNNVSSRITRARANTAEFEAEMKQDDEYFADFYDRHVATGHVAYMEKYLSNSGQTYSTIKSLEGQYSLFIVGRGGRVNSTLTAGMNDWEACPELGPIGDILSASDFSATASVLIIQQHKLRGKLQGLHEEFSIM